MGKKLRKAWSIGNRANILSFNIDGKRGDEIIVSSSFESFYILSNTGKWMGSTNAFGIIKSPIKLYDVNGDQVMDMVFVNQKEELIIIENASLFLRKIIEEKPIKDMQKPFHLFLAKLNRYISYQAYDKVAFAIANNTRFCSQYLPFIHFYQGAYLLAYGKNSQALIYFNSAGKYIKSFDNTFLKTLALLGTKQKKMPTNIFKNFYCILLLLLKKHGKNMRRLFLKRQRR